MENIDTKFSKKLTRKLIFDNILKQLEGSPAEIDNKLLNEIFDLLRMMDKKANEEIQNSLSNYVIIRSVSAIESFFRNYTRELIDKSNIPSSKIFPKDEKISLTELDGLKKKKITKGRIIAHITNFQDLNQINSIMSIILPVDDFFKEVKKLTHSFTYAGWNESTHFKIDEIFILFELRHKIVHEMSDFDDSPSKLRNYFAQVLMFLSTSNTVIEEANNKKSKKTKK